MRQAEDRDNVLDKLTLIDLETRQGDKGQGVQLAEGTKCSKSALRKPLALRRHISTRMSSLIAIVSGSRGV